MFQVLMVKLEQGNDVGQLDYNMYIAHLIW